jgi:UDP-2,3-diacylglucosamine pyrophosphatase LpxH
VSRRGKDIGRYLGGKQKKGKKKEGKGKKKELKPTRNQSRKPKYVPKVFDLHEKALHQAKEYIKEKIKENISRKSCLHFIHGHTHGDKIRTYLRDGGLQSWIDSQEISVEIWNQDNGTTFVESK